MSADEFKMAARAATSATEVERLVHLILPHVQCSAVVYLELLELAQVQLESFFTMEGHSGGAFVDLEFAGVTA